MARSSWRNKQARSAAPIHGRSQKRAASQRATPHIETLENRYLLTTQCPTVADYASFNDAIDMVNFGLCDTIDTWAVTGAIKVPNDLHAVTNPVSIIAPVTSSPISIEPADGSIANFGLQILGGASTVKNLAIGGFVGTGKVGLILDNAGVDTVQGMFLGFGYGSGSKFGPLGNNQGMTIGGGAPNNTIGGSVTGQGNVIANNGNFGIEILTPADSTVSTHDRIIGNIIGTDINDTPNEGNGTGLVIESNGNTVGGTSMVERNIISGNHSAGISLVAASKNVIEGNYIGTKHDASLALPNEGVGISLMSQSNNNTIGGAIIGGGLLDCSKPTMNPCNLISGNLQGGIQIALSDNNVVTGDVIGLDPAGSHTIANGKFGIGLSGTGNTVGGATGNERNIISGNDGDGVQVSGIKNLVEQDFIGTNFAGTSAFANNGSGVVVGSGMENRIGGRITDAKVPLNLISGNKVSGIQIAKQAMGTMVQGNFIGTDITGTQPLGNATAASAGLLINAGISISGGATQSCVGGTFMEMNINACRAGAFLGDGKTSEYRNVISANQGPPDQPPVAPGVSITAFDTDPFSTTSNNLIAGNFIGTDWSGDHTSYRPDTMTPPVSLGNGRGIYIWGRASNNIVGDPTPRGATMTFGTRNIISGNSIDGVAIADRGTLLNSLFDNYIGTDLSGTLLREQIDDNHAGARFGNGEGVEILDGATGNHVGGYIRPDQSHGFVPPDTNMNSPDIFGHGNLIAGNLRNGVRIADTNTSQNFVQGNLIGNFIHDVNGTEIDDPLVSRDPNTGVFTGQQIGVALAGASSDNTVGGTVSDTIIHDMQTDKFTIPGGDIISGNTIYGVAFHDSRTYLNHVEGNMIGPDKTGLKAVLYQDPMTKEVFPVQPYGAAFYNGAGNAVFKMGNTLGGTTTQSRNIITGNLNGGVLIFGTPDPLDDEALPQYNVVEANYIGSNLTGLGYLKDPYHPLVDVIIGGNGIDIYFSAHDNTIGGTTITERNIITGNPLDGILIDAEAYRTVVEGNWIGLDSRGLHFVNVQGHGNGGNGIEINLGHNDPLPPHDNMIGKMQMPVTAAPGGVGNVISDNALDGILIAGGSTNNTIQFNMIGTDTAGNLRSDRSRRTDLGNGTQPDANGVVYNGIHIMGDGTNQNMIGGFRDRIMGVDIDPSNTIGFNGNDGILIDTGVSNPILANNIAFNNDPNDQDGSGVDSGIDLINGGNDMAAPPDTIWITSITFTGALVTFNISIPPSLMANTQYILELYLNSYQPLSGVGDGERFAGGASFTTDGMGGATFTVQYTLVAGDVGYYQWVTMTLTYPGPNGDLNPPGDTSGFSNNSSSDNVPFSQFSATGQAIGVVPVQGITVTPVQVVPISAGVTLMPLTGLTVQPLFTTTGTPPAAASADSSAQEVSSTQADRFFARIDQAFDSVAHALGRLHLGHHHGEADVAEWLLNQTDLSF